MFSRRTAVERAPNRLSEALVRARLGGRPVLDLTVSNPTQAGLPYPERRLVSALSNPRAVLYSPAPFGLLATREVVAAHSAEAGAPVDPGRVVLTASTSEAYAFLFKLLCDDGDEVLVPQPSYPLFDTLARLEGVRLVPYPLAYDGLWYVDTPALRRAVTSRTRAVIVVSPNNPTGSYLKQDEAAALASLGLPILSDEVFASFSLSPGDDPSARRAPSIVAAGAGDLVFALNGLSKVAGLPQMKLGWILVGGTDTARIDEALGRLEIIADAFLSVGTPVQLAAAELLAGRSVTQAAIQRRLEANLGSLRRLVAHTPVTLLHVEGGWYATLRLPAVESEQDWAVMLIEQDAVFVHPGYLFDFPEEAYAVVSLLTPEETLHEGVRRIVARVERRTG